MHPLTFCALYYCIYFYQDIDWSTLGQCVILLHEDGCLKLGCKYGFTSTEETLPCGRCRKGAYCPGMDKTISLDKHTLKCICSVISEADIVEMMLSTKDYKVIEDLREVLNDKDDMKIKEGI